jgi:hypothetical protein
MTEFRLMGTTREGALVPILSTADGKVVLATAPARRHDFQGAASFCGTAPHGSAEEASVWRVTRLTIGPSGNVVLSETAQAVAWTQRAVVEYD